MHHVLLTAVPSSRRRLTRLTAWVGAALLLATAGACAAQAATPGTLTANLTSPGAATRLFGDAVQSNGQVVAVGESGTTSAADVLLVRYATSGALDGSFGSGGIVHGPTLGSGNGSVGRAVAVQGDGKIVVVGKISGTSGRGASGVLVERYNANGSLDSSFGSGGVVRLFTDTFGDGYGLAVQSNGKIVVSGSADAAGPGGTTPRVVVARLNANGALDPSFAGGGQEVIDDGANSVALAVTLQSDGKIVIAGSQSPNLQSVNALLSRLSANGQPDPSYHTVAPQYARNSGAASQFNAVAVQPNGQIVAAGAATDGNRATDAVLARFSASGTADGSFGSGGVVYTPAAVNLLVTPATIPGANAVAVAANGVILTAGTAANGLITNGVLRAYGANGAALSSFGSGGAVSTPVSGSNAEEAGLAIGPDGTLAVVGDTSSEVGGSFAGSGALYVGVAAPVVPPGATLRVTLSRVSPTKIHAVVTHGLSATAGCNQGCTIQVKLTASAGTAKQLHLKTRTRICTKRHGKRTCKRVLRYRTLTVASGRVVLGAAGSKRFTLKLSRTVGGAVGQQKRVRLTLHASAKSTKTHKTASTSKALTLKP